MPRLDPRITVLGQEELGEAQLRPIVGFLRRRGLIVVRDVYLTAAQFEEFVADCGTVIDHPFVPPGYEGHRFSVLERSSDRIGDFIYGGAWHQNLMFLQEPPDVTILYSSTIRDEGNFTAFVDLTEVGQWYSDGVRSLLQSSSAIHSTAAPDSPQNAYPDRKFREGAPQGIVSAVHPCYLTDSATGLSWPFVTSNYITGLAGWRADESMPLVRQLRQLAMLDEFVIRHYWCEGDLLLWDNRRFMHRATVTHKAGTRILWRTDLQLGWGIEAFSPERP